MIPLTESGKSEGGRQVAELAPGPERTREPPRLRRPGLLAGLSGAVLAAGLLSGCGGTASVAGGAAGTTITISAGRCGQGWAHPHTGPQTFRLHNVSSGAAEVYLIDPAGGNLDPDSISAPVYAEVEGLGPGTTTPMQIDVGSGGYAFECELQYYGPRIGPIIQIPGQVRGTPGILSVTYDNLAGGRFSPAAQYRDYVSAGLNTLVTDTDALLAAVRAGNLSAARQDWLTAHLTYERLGAAYGTFGDFDAEIDGRPDGLPGGVSSPAFTGFYRVEYGLWHGQTAAALTGPVRKLDDDVRGLRAGFPHLQLALSDLGLRTHEILENALQFQLTGHDDYGSGTTLATTLANIAGTRELLQVLHVLLVARYSGLPQVSFWLNRLQNLILAARHPDGSWTPVSQLSSGQREQIDAAAGQTLQVLAPIAAIFEVEKQL
jgi:iron uptake system component EfeO